MAKNLHSVLVVTVGRLVSVIKAGRALDTDLTCRCLLFRRRFA